MSEELLSCPFCSGLERTKNINSTKDELYANMTLYPAISKGQARLYVDLSTFEVFEFRIDYCPMCGRKVSL